jgi:hypothetical protein
MRDKIAEFVGTVKENPASRLRLRNMLLASSQTLLALLAYGHFALALDGSFEETTAPK